MTKARQWVTATLQMAYDEWQTGHAYPDEHSDLAAIHKSLYEAMDLSNAHQIEDVIMPLGVALTAWKNGSTIDAYREQMVRAIDKFGGVA